MRILKLCSIALLLPILVLILINFFYGRNGLKHNLKSSETVYFEKLGYVNLGHSKNKETQKFYQHFIESQQIAKDSFLFEYSQNVRFNILGVKIRACVSEVRKFPNSANELERKLLFFEIFKSVSTKFESYQGSLPLILLLGSSDSSFRNGDLMGNFISYISSVDTFDLKDFDTIPPPHSTAKEKINWRELNEIIRQNQEVFDNKELIAQILKKQTKSICTETKHQIVIDSFF